MIEYVTGFMFSTCRRHVVLVSKLKPEWQHGKVNGVGGKVEPGETAADAMAREFMEEAMVASTADEWVNYVRLVRPGSYKIDFFFMSNAQAFSARRGDAEEIGIFPVDALPDNVIPNLRWLIPLALDPGLRFDAPLEIVEAAPPLPERSMMPPFSGRCR
ncbi:NUDIX domain-containing protein [Caballeronia sp. LZ065]|uniref:NUDIX domain-containing protein n=1 Tax=Caballeronia sp. LZ065 TaxID=3038571 RepID=UPI00285AF12C|nr:NUDIX domain-containing protein [Caballeronia sp. LZ065]MDR5781828.1 NUDIX domain-containing protein [Caballeronia sp. LZ065]